MGVVRQFRRAVVNVTRKERRRANVKLQKINKLRARLPFWDRQKFDALMLYFAVKAWAIKILALLRIVRKVA